MFAEERRAEIAKLVASARRVVLLCDSAKFGNESLVRFADFEDIDTLITDRAPEGELAQAMEGAGVEVIIA